MNDGIEREIWIEFRLINKLRDREENSGTWHGRPPLFCFGLGSLSRRLGADQTVINLPFMSVARCSASLDDFIAKILSIIQTYQRVGPYFLAGYCAEGYVAYEIARRLASSGQELGLLALIECTGAGGRGWDLFARRLLLSMTYPTELVRYVGRKLNGLKAQVFGARGAGEERSSSVDLFKAKFEQLNRLFRDFWKELDQGRATYPGSLVLLFGDRSRRRFFPTRGWRRSVRGKIEVLVMSGDHYERLFAGENLVRELRACIDRALSNLSMTDRLIACNGSAPPWED